MDEQKSQYAEDLKILEKLLEQQNLKIDHTHEEHWKQDMDKCAVGNEFLFQRTIMMTTIDRHDFADFKTTFDYNTELEWKSDHPPTSDPEHPLWAPKPDLCVGFRRNQLFKKSRRWWRFLPAELKACMVPEKLPHGKDVGRAFPFLMFEAKGASADLGGRDAHTHNRSMTQPILYITPGGS